MEETLKILKDKLNRIKIEKMPNTFLDVLNKTRDEVLTSSWVAFALNPEITNIGIIEQILEKTQSDVDESDFLKLIKEKDNLFISIEVEKWISKRSRIDIIIKFSKFWIIIENKVDSEENGDQSNRYEEDLKNVRVPKKYICLKPDSNKCILENKKFVNITYAELVDILKHFSKEDLKNEKDYIYLKELIKHLEVHLVSNKEIKIDEMLQFYIEDKPKMDAIVKNYNEQCKLVREKLIERIKYKMENNYTVSEKNTNYIQVWKKEWPARIHYEIGYDLIDIIGKENEVIYRIDNETGEYPNIPKEEIIYREKYDFDTLENIEESIEKISTKLLEIAQENDEIIDVRLKGQTQYLKRKIDIMDRLEGKIKEQFEEENNYITHYGVNKNIEYIQVWKKEWDNTAYMGIHYEILCNMKNLAEGKIEVTLAIHNEAKTKRKYPNINMQDLSVQEYIVDTEENIEKAITTICKEFCILVEENNDKLEEKIRERR